MATGSRTVGDVEGFVYMLLAACEDAQMNATLEKLLSLPDRQRQGAVQLLLAHLHGSEAPQDLVDAIACLMDDQVAERAYEVIFKCAKGLK